MPNPFYTGNSFNVNRAQPQNQSTNLKDIYKMLKNSNNPTELFMNIAKDNPNMQPIANLLNKGYTPERIFNEMCKQRGINPQEFIKQLNS